VLKFLCKKYEKHPDRLSFQDAQEIFMAIENDPEASHWENGVKVKGGDSYHARRVLKDFLKSKGAADWEKIGVGKPSGFAHYKTLFVEKPVLMKMFEWIKAHDFKVYVVDKVMYHNGLRLSAVLNAKIEDFKIDDEWCELTVLEKFREVKTFMLVREVAELIKQVIGDRKEGKIFDGVLPTQVNSLNREALKQFAPDLEPKIEMPSHFFRHMCAQHLLRATDWNSKVVAAIMQCTEQSLNESYGGAPTGEFKKWCAKYLPELSMRMTT
jgi:integrase